MKRFDKNGDGKIDDDERADAQEEMLKERTERMARRTPPASGGPEAFRAQMLAMFDRNKDGRLDDDERVAADKFARDNALTPTGELSPELLQRFDRNANGRIDDDERPALQAFIRDRMADPSSGPQAALRKLRPQFDRDGNGRIDEAEMSVIEAGIRPKMEALPILVLRYDGNGDGRIDDQEWTGAREEVLRMLNAPEPAEDKERLDRVAEDLRRRRAEREKSGK